MTLHDRIKESKKRFEKEYECKDKHCMAHISDYACGKIWDIEEFLASELRKIAEEEREAIIKEIEEYVENHEKDTKPWNTYSGREVKRIIERDILASLKHK